MSESALVIGGGFAGLSAAVALTDAGIRVTLLEAKNSLGGRARSFSDPATGETVDNGQHLFLGAYDETLAFLKRLGTADSLVFQDRLSVTFVEPGGKTHTLTCPRLPAPWHLVFGMMGFSGLTLRDKLRLSRVTRALRGDDALDAQTVQEWLVRLGQSERICSHFWYPVAVATLNENPAKASAAGWVTVLRKLFFSGWTQTRLGIPSVGLSELYTGAAQRIIEEGGGQVKLNASVRELTAEGTRVTGVRLADETVLSVEGVVSALPPAALLKILPPEWVSMAPAFGGLAQFTTSAILSINLWLDHPVTDAPFVGFIGTRIQWLFNKPRILGGKTGYLSLIVSAAGDLMELSNERLVAMALQELTACFPKAGPIRALRSQVVRERDATVSLRPGMEALRPGPQTRFLNLFLAGDWTATGLPATIESAVVSGKKAAQVFLKRACLTEVQSVQ